MWAGIIIKLKQWALQFVVMPFLSKLIVMIVERFKDKERADDIDEAIEKYRQAQTPEEQEDAFKELVRRARSRRAK